MAIFGNFKGTTQSGFKIGKADAALAASVSHFGEIAIPQLKNILKKENIATRIIK